MSKMSELDADLRKAEAFRVPRGQYRLDGVIKTNDGRTEEFSRDCTPEENALLDLQLADDADLTRTRDSIRNYFEDQGLDHPCRETCLGWQQGYDKGKSEALPNTFGEAVLQFRHAVRCLFGVDGLDEIVLSPALYERVRGEFARECNFDVSEGGFENMLACAGVIISRG